MKEVKRIVMIHTDFRIYWPARINHFFQSLDKTLYDLTVIEISGHGGNYSFDSRRELPGYWECLFPDTPINELHPTKIKKAILEKFNTLKPGVLIAGALAFPSGANALAFATNHNVPIIMFDDARLEDIPRNFFVNWIKRELYSGVDAIFCPAPAWNETYKYFGFKKEQLFYGVDVVDNEFFKEETKGDPSLDWLGEKYILNVGRQIEKKNLTTFLNAYYHLYLEEKKIPNVVLVGDGDERKKLEVFVDEKGLSQKVFFLTYQTQDKLRQIYKNASIFILPSSYGETWGLVINEAMVSGLPVIVSNKVGCARTLIQEGKNGYVFDISSQTSLREKLSKFFSLNELEKEQMGQNSLGIINHWGLDKFSLQLTKALDYVDKGPKRKPSVFGCIFSRFWKGRYKSI